MKTFILFVVIAGLFSACQKDDDSNPAPQITINELKTAITNGTWRVTNFNENSVNQTQHFSGFTFTFNSANTVAAVNNTTTYNGTWATGVDDSNPKFIMNFSVTSGPFEEISEDWRIIAITATTIDLQHVSGGDGDIDLLTFTRN
jgi:hypothetical protein